MNPVINDLEYIYLVKTFEDFFADSQTGRPREDLIDKYAREVVAFLQTQRGNQHKLLFVLKLAYRKHHLGDETIGWDELGNKMCDALCDAMGDEEYRKWSVSQRTASATGRMK